MKNSGDRGKSAGNTKVLSAETRVVDAGSLLFEPGHQLYDIVRGGKVIGSLSKSDLLRLMCAGEGETTLATAVGNKVKMKPKALQQQWAALSSVLRSKERKTS
jgi:hypothetical protein